MVLLENNFTMNPQHKQNKQAARQHRIQRTLILIEDSLNREVLSDELNENLNKKGLGIPLPAIELNSKLQKHLESLREQFRRQLIH